MDARRTADQVERGFSQHDLKALSRAPMSADVCAALTVNRKRASPRATVGYRIAGMKIPSSDNTEASERVFASSPTIIGMIALRTTGIRHPLLTKPFFTLSTLDQSKFRRCSPSSDCTS